MDTSAAHCAVALVCGDEILGSAREEMIKGQAERLIPMLVEVLRNAGKSWKDLDRIAVCSGPGNFTGVRIAVSTARSLALGLDIPAVGVTAFEALAFGTKGSLCVTLDARRGEVFWQKFTDGIAVTEPAVASVDVIPLGVVNPVDPVSIAKCAAAKTDFPRPAPLYLRSADAALPSDPNPEILL